MKIIITPAKKMRDDHHFLAVKRLPAQLETTKRILKHLKTLSLEEVKRMLKCSDAIAKQACLNYQTMDLTNNLVCAILAYQGIQYDYMHSDLFSEDDYAYLDKHLVILSGFYGVLRPLDGVVPYRLELNNYYHDQNYHSLYQLWNCQMYQELIKDTVDLLDLGAKQYSKMIQKYLTNDINYVRCYFYENRNGNLKEIGVYVKMARGAMVRYLIENRIDDFQGVKKFQELGYRYHDELSSKHKFVFVKDNDNL